ncbi:hypothetical protein CAEBREN_12734 [Caenorhabditis brenneri]|uniref:Uncharacterized protein n=1 Tax=Caenorhabditis brenneri TaxID=135651 RepID=G0MD20_CAEBE|nr:hypothetical protein CAEBREN_12734 [Caenorhabditis brenneri]
METSDRWRGGSGEVVAIDSGRRMRKGDRLCFEGMDCWLELSLHWNGFPQKRTVDDGLQDKGSGIDKDTTTSVGGRHQQSSKLGSRSTGGTKDGRRKIHGSMDGKDFKLEGEPRTGNEGLKHHGSAPGPGMGTAASVGGVRVLGFRFVNEAPAVKQFGIKDQSRFECKSK